MLISWAGKKFYGLMEKTNKCNLNIGFAAKIYLVILIFHFVGKYSSEIKWNNGKFWRI